MSNEHLSASELLDAYLDGELNETQTQSLFGLLAQNPELQAEMREQLHIRNAIQSASFQAPEHLMQSVLVRTGLATAPAQEATALSSSLLSRIAGNRLFVALCSSLLSCGATVWYMNTHTQESAAIAAAPHVERIQPADIRLEQPIHHVQSGQPLAESKGRPVAHREQRIEKHESEESPIRMLVTDASMHSPELSFSPVAHSVSTREQLPVTNDRSEIQENTPLGLSIHLRGFASHSFSSVDLPSVGTPSFMNMSTGIFYQLTSSDAIGIEVGRESFIQEYDGVENALHVRYEQNYPALWAGVAYQRTFESIPLLYGAQPFARVFAGGTQTGPLGRMMLGTTYTYDNSIAFTLGLEGTLLMYQYQKQWFTTSKLGITYGVSYTF